MMAHGSRWGPRMRVRAILYVRSTLPALHPPHSMFLFCFLFFYYIFLIVYDIVVSIGPTQANRGQCRLTKADNDQHRPTMANDGPQQLMRPTNACTNTHSSQWWPTTADEAHKCVYEQYCMSVPLFLPSTHPIHRFWQANKTNGRCINVVSQ